MFNDFIIELPLDTFEGLRVVGVILIVNSEQFGIFTSFIQKR